MKVIKRLNNLRRLMEERGIDYYFVTTCDDHGSEYVDDHFKVREYLSGFTGSNGNLLVGLNFAGLWTDGRYFIQAERELEGSNIKLFRTGEEGVPTIEQFLEKELGEGKTLAFDGRCICAQLGEKLESLAKDRGAGLMWQEDLAEVIWQDRAPRRAEKIFLLPESICGRTAKEKVGLIRKKLEEKGAKNLILSKLDDIMWLFNVRGGDIDHNPVALSYAVITPERSILFVQKQAWEEGQRKELLERGIILEDYDAFWESLEEMRWKGDILFDRENSSFALLKQTMKLAKTVFSSNPTEELKAVKTKEELAQMRRVYLEDSLAVCRFMRWLKENAGKISMTELSAGEYMDELRRKTEGFLDLSFPTICAYQENAAMMHYQATQKVHKEIRAEGMLLVDSGGQYLGGTTDVTRTYGLGEVQEEIKDQYTAVVMGMLRLLNAKFLHGCTGRNLDILARGPLWDMGIDYKCGTGHGIGYILNVHEGPQNIRWKFTQEIQEAVLEEGMVLSNEPGVYKDGSHGIRIENIMAVRKGIKNEDGQFMEFEGLTFVPIDQDLLNPRKMERRDVENLNRYHQEVYEKISPFMEEEERQWLRQVTAMIDF